MNKRAMLNKHLARIDEMEKLAKDTDALVAYGIERYNHARLSLYGAAEYLKDEIFRESNPHMNRRLGVL